MEGALSLLPSVIQSLHPIITVCGKALSLLCAGSASPSICMDNEVDSQVNTYFVCQVSLEVRFILQFAKTAHLTRLSLALL